jgi:hypothetical protein
VSMAAKRGVVDEVLVGARAAGPARPGSHLAVRVRLQRRGGGRRTVTVRVPVPRDLPPGGRTLSLSGNGFRSEVGLFIELIEIGLAGPTARSRRTAARSAQTGPRTVRLLARRVAALRRPLGIVARFGRRDPRVVLRSRDVRFDGRVKVRLRVRRARR